MHPLLLQTRIHARIKQPLVKNFAHKLEENKVYHIANVSVAQYKMSLKAASHKYKLFFMLDSKIVQQHNATFPTIIYNFRPFPEILCAPHDDELLFGKDKQLLDIILEDLDN